MDTLLMIGAIAGGWLGMDLMQRKRINILQETIVRQEVELYRLSRFSHLCAILGTSAAVGAGLYFLYTKLRTFREEPTGSDWTAPPTSYEPSPARNEKEECVVCLQNRRDTLLQPCRHLQVCWACSTGLNSCPTCRSHITTRIHTFNS
ncbi:Zinc finger, C3HC4 type (RING finger), putative [Trypanosoma equiperdum]|uniref:RING-type domain-containing protein n=4 Tax=Trypanozoon TaxID=39700 RepID=Q388Z7_TRYB2|nr:hypothetical protein, conserved [Trypanosoma brucei gambiense DAL972]XP_823451.1 hypothetical protein, conserved [Trypanosoma brucei brucei TREU927]RHW69639.1 zinc finger protein [Trypanosoma brucei equiperdum]SCU65053.1 Zinc finger, C3HC4 type (RING finger), putative [Trypanosoma equiperdum]EAN78623.1 hypothetical protein, conserved [Trypanosoma brucei brucei TREU927]CBH16402.1 hypothetical protein, conserved [Trypanosoma brucei gambiense DAL972]|eukprot:XP_011778666.1 hypothetical protein, conserved [Trypanosoma brucei gambiense DAL972]